jgi:hypothetical protein
VRLAKVVESMSTVYERACKVCWGRGKEDKEREEREERGGGDEGVSGEESRRCLAA